MADESDNEDEREDSSDDESSDDADERDEAAADESASDESADESDDDESDDDESDDGDEDESDRDDEPAAESASESKKAAEAAAAADSAPRERKRAKKKSQDDDEDADDDDGAVAADDGETRTLGIERWVQFAFVVITVAAIFLADKIITMLLGYAAAFWSFSEPDSNFVLAGAVVVGAITGVLLYRNKKVNPLAHEVATELSKVTWPSRQETWYSTIVVIVTSLIMAAYLGAFDALWSAFTDLVYSTTGSPPPQ